MWNHRSKRLGLVRDLAFHAPALIQRTKSNCRRYGQVHDDCPCRMRTFFWSSAGRAPVMVHGSGDCFDVRGRGGDPSCAKSDRRRRQLREPSKDREMDVQGMPGTPASHSIESGGGKLTRGFSRKGWGYGWGIGRVKEKEKEYMLSLPRSSSDSSILPVYPQDPLPPLPVPPPTMNSPYLASALFYIISAASSYSALPTVSAQ